MTTSLGVKYLLTNNKKVHLKRTFQAQQGLITFFLSSASSISQRICKCSTKKKDYPPCQNCHPYFATENVKLQFLSLFFALLHFPTN